MKKHLFKSSLGAFVLVFLGLTAGLLNPSATYAQCSFLNNQYPAGNVASPTTLGQVVQVSTCSFGGEFASVTGFQAYYTYSINIQGLATPYITVFDASNVAVAWGNAPLSFTPTVSGNYKTQWTTSAPPGCGTDGSCHITTVTLTQMVPPPPPTPTQDPGVPTCSTGTNLTIAGSPGAGETWYWQTSASGTSTATPYAGPYTVFANGTYYVRTYSTTLGTWSVATSVTVSNFPVATAPPAPTVDVSPSCAPAGSILTEAAAPMGYVYYWQGTNPSGSSMALNASSTYNATSSGTYYVAAYETATQCWSAGVGIPVVVDTQIPDAPGANPAFYNYCTSAVTMPAVAQVPVSYSNFNCSSSASASGTDNTGVTATVTDFSCASSGTIVSASLNASIGTQCTVWYYYSIVVNGVTVATQQCNQSGFDLTPYLPLTSVSIVSADNPADGFGDFINMNLTVDLTYSAPSIPQPAFGLTWYDASSGGNNLGSGPSIETIGTSVMPTPVVGSYDYYVGTTLGGCVSASRTMVTVNVTDVLADLTPVDVTCNGGNNGSFTLGTVQCGTGSFTYTVDGVGPGPIPTNLTAGTHIVYIHDGASTSAPIAVTIGQPGPPTALTATNVTYYNADLGWTTSGDETSWTVIYGPAGFDPATSGTVVPTTTNPLQVVGDLTADTQYEFYVFATCGPQPDTAGPFAFATDPGFYTYDNVCGPAFVDISATGTDLALTDDSEAGVTLPWPWSINGTAVNTITVGNNGGVLFNTLAGNVGYGAFGTGFFPFAQDLNTANPGGGVFWESVGVAPNRQLIVMWKDLPHYDFPAATDGSTFELIVEESGDVYFVYQDVVLGDAAFWDYGADAEIAANTPNGNAVVSVDDAAYLTSNSCVHFYNELCPNPTNLTSLIFADDAILDWDAGLYGEVDWTVIYGPAGFDPQTSGTTLLMSSSDASFGGTLTQLTEYDVYIYAECAADNLTSPGLFFNFTTLPYCSIPSNLTGATDVDSLEVAWNWTASSPTYPVTSFNISYVMAGNGGAYDGIEVVANGLNFADTIFNTNLLAGGVYEVYVQAACAGTNDTSSYFGPITLVMPLSNDTVCGAENLTLGSLYTFNNGGATVSPGEAPIAPPADGAQVTTGWTNSTLNGTTWFTFVAPASGSVRVNGNAIDYNGQIGVYDVIDCGDFGTFALVAANDNEIDGPSVAPNFTICGLNPGDTYYLLMDGFTAATGDYSIMITPIVLEAGTSNPVTDICTGSDIDLFTTVAGNDAGGVWSSDIAAVNASINGSDFTSAGLAYQVFDFQYRVTDGCAYDSIITQVHVYPPSDAGDDGSITACRNEPINLLAGLNGTTDFGGTWYDPSNNALASSAIVTSNIAGQFNYDYIAGNGVCPDDTANVVVTVLPTCDYLEVADELFYGVSLFPNPSEGIVFIASDATQSFDYVVTDANGRLITELSNGVKAGQTTEINLNNMETGVYFIKLSNEQAEKVFRVVIQ